MATNAPVRRVVTRPSAPVDPGSLEEISREAIEIIAMWEETVLRVDILGASDGRRRYRIGDDPSCDFQISREQLGGRAAVTLVDRLPDGGALLTLPERARGDVSSADGRRIAIEQLGALGRSYASGVEPGCACVPLGSGDRAKVDLGGLTFLVGTTARPRALASAVNIDWRDQIFSGASLAFHFLVVFVAFFDVPNLMAMSLDLFDDGRTGVRYAPIEQRQKKLEEQEKKQPEKSAGMRHAGEEGKAGKRDAAKTNGRMGIKGRKDNPRPTLARFDPREAGILGMLRPDMPVSPFGSDDPSGVDPENALAGLQGDRFLDDFGYGGLGIYGTGRHGGGRGLGTIGVGNIPTVGGAYDPGLPPRRERPPRLEGPTTTSGPVTIKGSLSKDVIRRVVHRHLNEVKFCYEKELAARPDLSGRVSIKFIISGTGAVQAAAAADSTVGSPVLDRCIANAVLRWSFPQPEGGGIVVVTYPFQLENSGS